MLSFPTLELVDFVNSDYHHLAFILITYQLSTRIPQPVVFSFPLLVFSPLLSSARAGYMNMMLEEGMLHCDPHPGNLLRTPDGKLCMPRWGQNP